MSLRTTDVVAWYGLGSCVAVAIYQEGQYAGAMAHIVLPKKTSASLPPGDAYYADGAIPMLVEALRSRGYVRLKAKMAGGASVLPFHAPDGEVGARNVQAVKQYLNALGVELTGEDVGGNLGRTVRFYASSGLMVVTTLSGYRRVI
ncbi:MAG: chemotaxis protein CheD [Bacillota bacterium]